MKIKFFFLNLINYMNPFNETLILPTSININENNGNIIINIFIWLVLFIIILYSIIKNFIYNL